MTIANQFKEASSGGIVGACDFGTVKISYVDANNITILGENVRDAGGVIAAGRNNGELEVKNCTLNGIQVTASKADRSESYIGGIVGYHNKSLTVTDVELKNSSVSGQRYGGGFTGYTSAAITITNCTEDMVNIKAGGNWNGGFTGYLAGNKTAIFQNCREKNVNVLGRYAGGLAGAIDGSVTASNMTFDEVMAITNINKSPYYAGLLTGNTANMDNIQIKFWDTIF